MLDLAYLSVIQPIEALMRWCLESTYFAAHSYGVAIILLSVFVSLFTLPLYAIAENWQVEQRDLRSSMAPGLEHIKKAFVGQEQFFMVKTLYRQHDYHPVMALRSSLGLLIQVPFFFAAYHFLHHYQPLDGVSFLWFENLALPDRSLSLGPFSLNVMPLVMTAINLYSVRLHGQDFERREKVQLYLLAAFFLILLYDSPVALVLYWTINNVLSIGKDRFVGRGGPTRAQYRLGSALGRVTLTPIGLTAVALPALTCIALLEASLLPDSVTIPATFSSFGLLAYLGIVSVGAFVRAFSPTPANLLRLAFIFTFIAFTVFALSEALAARQSINALAQARTGIWVGLVSIVVTSTATFPAAARRLLPRIDEARPLFFLSALLLAAVLCVSSPLSLFVSDPTQFSIGLTDALAGTTLIGLAGLVLLSATYFALPRGLRGPYTFLLFWVAVVVCLYTFILVGDYGSIDFFTLDDQAFMTPALYVLDVVVVAVGGAVTLYVFRGNRSRSAARLLTMSIIATLLVSGYQLSSAELPLDEQPVGPRETGHGLAPLPEYNDDLLGFSRHEKNIVVLMLDAFNAFTLPVSLKREPALGDALDGFTWYPNSLSAGHVTALGEPGIHGGHDYTPVEIQKREYTNLTDETAKGYRVFSDTLGDKGFDVSYAGVQNVSCEKIETLVRRPPLVCVGNRYGNDYATSLAWPGREDRSLVDGTSGDEKGGIQQKVMVAISLFRAAPFSLKEAVYADGAWLNTYPRARKNVDEARNAARDLAGLYALAGASSVTSEKPTFKYIQNNTTHRPFYIDAQTCLPSLRQSDDEAARDCALRVVIQWVRWLDDQGIFDNTMIVLVSDHGSRRIGSSLGIPLTRTNALLMVKDFGQRGALKVSDRFMSNADVPAIVCAAAGGCPGIQADPRQLDSPRTLYFVKGTNRHNHDRLSEENIVYRVENDIFDAENWSVVQ